MSTVLHPYFQNEPFQTDNGEPPDQSVDMDQVTQGLTLYVDGLLEGEPGRDMKKALYYRNGDDVDMQEVARQMHHAIVMDVVVSVICAIRDYVEVSEKDFKSVFTKRQDHSKTLVYPRELTHPMLTMSLLVNRNMPFYREEGKQIYMVPFYDTKDVKIRGPREAATDMGKVVWWRTELPDTIEGTVFKITRDEL